MLQDKLRRQLRENKLFIIAEIVVIWLIPALWKFLPVERTIIPILSLGWLSLWFRQLKWRDVGLKQPHNWLLTILVGITVGALIALVGNLVIRPIVLERTGEAFVVDPRDFSFLQGNLPIFLIIVVFNWSLGAVAEEMVYRGYILNRLTDLFGYNKLGWGSSIMLSALMFSLSHGVYTPLFILVSSLAGLLYGGLYMINQNNLWLPIIIHGIANSIGLTLVFLGIIGG